VLIGPLANFGDWAAVARTLQPPLLWIIGFIVLGWQLIVAASRLARRPQWQPLLGTEPAERETRMQLLTRIPLAGALVVSLAAGLLSPLRPQYALVTSVIAPLVLLWLVRLPTWPESEHPDPPVRIAASWTWLTVGVLVGLGFVLLLGPGIGSFEGYSIAR
jgi:hypothetical protein